ncbi:uncharacterized protein LOC111469390 [Cucurbita maxima]|uniref:Uncharacterized protein LOC111469390 n=1 Tax=Cucurbita maxima TaxID=3661 RepID=A0A6J1I5C8_CUCMA|nr:uncharacterized protein LOC111469390 [Cucurbita maxima]
MGNKNKLEDPEKKSVSSPWSRTTPLQQRSTTFPGHRSTPLWIFLFVFILYLLYSANILVLERHEECPTAVDSSTEVHIRTLTNISSTNNINDNDNDNDNDEDDDDDKFFPFDEEEEEQMKIEPVLPLKSQRYDTELKHIVFGIAGSSNLWSKRKEYIKLWWRPEETRGAVWLDKKVYAKRNEGLPPIRISGDTSKFKYHNRQGQRSALRISRVVSETLRLGMKDVRWLVMGDDDTVFMVENVVRVLSKYDHRQFYYIGSCSESHVQNIYFSYAMAYGGGGFAISYPLAQELEKMQDRCIQRYPGLYGSDDRIQACMAELGVPLTREPGFHQYDVYGDLLGLLGAHPVTPLLSLHHLDVVEPIFPRMTRVKALQRLFQAARLDPSSIMQQSICYDKKRYWSISVSWGYVVQILRGVLSPRELEMPTRTFLNWYRRADYTAYAFNTRPVTKHPCQKPFVFYMGNTRYDRGKKKTISMYFREKSRHPYCRWKMSSPDKIESIIVLKKIDPHRWQRSPRRDCCRVLPSHKPSTLYISVGSCRGAEISDLDQ